MNLSAQFKAYLLSQRHPASKATVKNYLSDVNRFLSWFEAKFGRNFEPKEVSPEMLESFKAEGLASRSASSVERNLSSLRKFFTFLSLENIISRSPFEANISRENEPDPWRLKDYKNFLYVLNSSPLTIKNYVIDIKQFKNWLEETIPPMERTEGEISTLIYNIDSRLISDYKNRLLQNLRLSPTSVNRKLSSLRGYISWAKEQNIIKNEEELSVFNESKAAIPLIMPVDMITEADESVKKPEKAYSSFPPIRILQKSKKGAWLVFDTILIAPLALMLSQLDKTIWVASGRPVFEADAIKGPIPSILDPLQRPSTPVRNIPKSYYAPTHISVANFPLHRQIWYHIRYTRPEWYRKYHSYTFTSYLHFAILMLAVLGFGYMIFLNSENKTKTTAVLGSLTVSPDRTLSFQGRITDAKGSVINTGRNLRMSIYSSGEASGSALLWQEVNFANPDQDGIFHVTLGQKTPIPQTLFTQNPALWLGIAVEDTTELAPREPIATVAYSQNSQTLQDLEPITNSPRNSNVILALNSSGNLTIGGSSSHVFRVTGGDFTLTGQTMVLNTNPGSNGDIRLSPDGSGTVDIQKAIQNTSNNNDVVPSAVQVNDMFVVSEATLDQAVLGVNQKSIGDLIIASASGITKFLVDNAGNITAKGSYNGLSVLEGTVTIGTWNGATIEPKYGGTGLDTSGTTGFPFISSGKWVINGDALAVEYGGTGISSYTTGDIIYANGDKSLTRLGIGASGNCLVSNGSSPSWGSCSVTPASNNQKWSSSLGAIFPVNSTEDILVGGTSSTSAKFAILNINSPRGSQVASLSGDLVLDKSGSVQTTNKQALTLGGGGTGDIFLDGDSFVLGKLSLTISDNNGYFVCKSSSGTGAVTLGQCNGSAAQSDITEAVTAPDAEEGDIVEFASGELQGQSVEINQRQVYAKKAVDPDNMAGIISTWGIKFDTNRTPNPDDKHMSTAGITPLKVNLEGGKISKGDPITVSSIPGVGKKADGPGFIVARAAEDYSGPTEGKILALLNISWFDPGLSYSDFEGLSLSSNSNDYAVKTTNNNLDKLGAFSDLIVARLKAGYLELGRLTVTTAQVAFANIGELSTDSLAIATENVTIAGQNIRDYITAIVDARISQKQIAISSPILETDIIKPENGNTIAIKLPTNDSQSKLEIRNASDSAVASIDGAGNATFAGTLNSNEASVAGTIRAGRLVADSLDLSKDALNSLQNSIGTNSAIVNNYYYSNPQETENIKSSNATGSATLASITADYGIFMNGFTSLGDTSFYDVSVANRLFVGAQLSIADKSINVLGSDLQIQPLSQGGVNFLDGKIVIDTKGNLTVNGNANFAKNVDIQGKLAAGIISPLPGKGLVFQLDENGNETSQIQFRPGTGSAVLSFNNKGDINSSGSGTFNKLNLNIIPKAIAVSDTEIIATGSAGTAEIKPYQNELTIKNPLVTKDSLIYITPKTSVSNQSIYLLRQVDGQSFTVGLSKVVSKSVPFNWILIN